MITNQMKAKSILAERRRSFPKSGKEFDPV
jgi:hypothetical protein